MPKNRILKLFLLFIGSFILAVGLYNIHSIAEISEGGLLGLTLLLEHHFAISLAYSSIIFNIICYGWGWRMFGKEFILNSLIAAIFYSIIYYFIEKTPLLFPAIVNYPLLASILGACFVGVGAGLCILGGGAVSGDDALALAISRTFHISLKTAYLLCDIIVLILSLTYIPLNKIVYSFITVIISGQIISLILAKSPFNIK